MPRPSAERLALLRAELLRKGLRAPSAQSIPRRAAGTTAPLSFAQERLYFLETYQPGSALYNDTLLLRIRGELEVARLRAALGAIQRRHEILRCSLELTPAGPVQRVHESLPLPLRELDFSGQEDAAARAREQVDRDARAPFALERPPAWRALLARVAPEEWLFSCTMHHAISDGTSYGILFRELEQLYGAELEARQAGLPALPVQFGDYAAWERAGLDEARAEADLSYWERVLGGELGAIEWPAVGRPAQRGGSVPLCLATPVLAALREQARSERTTTNQVLLAAWTALLAAATGTIDVRTGMASTLRRRAELEPLIGFFVQTLVLRVSLADDPDFRTHVARVRTAALEAEEHAALPYDRVARAVERRAGAPLLETYFSHMRDAIRAPDLGPARGTWEFVDAGVARFGLALVLHESEGELAGFLEYDRELVGRERAETLAADYARLVAAAAARPEQRLSGLAAGVAHLRSAPRRAARILPTRPRRAAG